MVQLQRQSNIHHMSIQAESARFKRISPEKLAKLKASTQKTTKQLVWDGRPKVQEVTRERSLNSTKQVKLLLAKIDNINVTGAEDITPPDLTGFQSFKADSWSALKKAGRYLRIGVKALSLSVLCLSLVGNAAFINRRFRESVQNSEDLNVVKKALDKAVYKSDAAVGNRYIEEGLKHQKVADESLLILDDLVRHESGPEHNQGKFQLALQAEAQNKTHLKALTQSLNKELEKPSEQQNPLEIDRLTLEIDLTQERLDDALGLINKVHLLKQVIRDHSAKAEAAISLGMKIKGDTSELTTKYLGRPALIAAGVTKSGFTIAQVGAAISAGKMSLEKGGEVLGVAGSTLEVLGLVGGGVSIASSGYKFYLASRQHNRDMNKVMMAEALTTDKAGRETMATELVEKALKLENSGWESFKAKANPFQKQSDPAQLRAWASQLRAIPDEISADNLEPEVKAVVDQIKAHSDLTRKRIGMALAVVGAIGATLSIIALSLAAPPLGLVIAGGLIGGVTGSGGLYMLYDNYEKNWRREKNASDLHKRIDQVDIKSQILNQELMELRAEKSSSIALAKALQEIQDDGGVRGKLLTGHQQKLSSLQRSVQSIGQQVIDLDESIVQDKFRVEVIEDKIAKLRAKVKYNTEAVQPIMDKLMAPTATQLSQIEESFFLELSSENTDMERQIKKLQKKIAKLKDKIGTNHIKKEMHSIELQQAKLSLTSQENVIQELNTTLSNDGQLTTKQKRLLSFHQDNIFWIDTQISERETKLETLSQLKSEATLNLLAVEPEAAALEIFKMVELAPDIINTSNPRYKSPDQLTPQDHYALKMKYIAEGILGLDLTNLPRTVALDALARGMPTSVNR